MSDDAGLWAALPVPAFLLDAQDRIAAANPAAELFCNASARTLAGQRIGARVETDAPLDEALARVRRDRAALFVDDVTLGTRERAPLDCNLQIAPVGEAGERVLLLVATRELAGRSGRAQGATAAAESAIGMAGMLAHEVKNPLAGIAGAAQLLAMSVGPQDRALAELIVEETRRVTGLLDRVAQIGSLPPPARRPVNIHDVLDRARRTAEMGAAAAMRISADYDPSLPPVTGDGDQLQQVFLNLMTNAAEAAGPGGGAIRLRSFYDRALRLRRGDGGGAPVPVQVEVIDDGPGLPEGLAEAVFAPFVSGRENGTGLGLALVSRILGEHGGWVAVESAPGRTVFRVALPEAPTEEGG